MTKPVDALWTRVICKQLRRYIGWPTITRTRAGELLAVFSGDREEHICLRARRIWCAAATMARPGALQR